MATSFKLGTFSAAGCAPFGGLVAAGRVIAFGALQEFVARERLDFHSDGSMLSVLDQWERNFPTLQRVAEALGPAADQALLRRAAPLEALALHAPVRSRNIICSGANYFKHVVDIVVAQVRPETQGMTPAQRREFGISKMTDRRLHGTPYFFIKANSTMIGPYDTVTLPPDVSTMDWELELGVVIGRRALGHRARRRAGVTGGGQRTSRRRAAPRAPAATRTTRDGRPRQAHRQPPWWRKTATAARTRPPDQAAQDRPGPPASQDHLLPVQ